MILITWCFPRAWFTDENKQAQDSINLKIKLLQNKHLISWLLWPLSEPSLCFALQKPLHVFKNLSFKLNFFTIIVSLKENLFYFWLGLCFWERRRIG